jgi:integrase
MPRPKTFHYKRQKDGYFHCETNGHHIKAKTEEELIAKKKAYAKQGTVTTVQTVAEYATYWLPIHKASVKASTFNAYLSILTTAVKPIGGIFLHELTSDHIAEALAALSGKSASYIHKARLLLMEILDSATDAGYIPKNPARASSVKAPKGTRGTHRAITQAERTAIEATTHRMRLAALIMLYCGLRRGELLGLKAEDIAGDSLTVRRAVYYVSNQPILSDTKTAASVRTVPAPDFILAQLPKMNRDCFVLTGTTKPMTEQVFTRLWSSFCKAAGITVRCHDLRHSYCTWLRDTGIDMHQAMLWMGHADEKMILRVYDHPGSDRETAAKNTLFAALSLPKSLPSSPEPSPTRTK